MNPAITLSAQEASELFTTGSLVKTVESEWQFGVECFDSMLSQTAEGKWLVSYFVETHKPRIGKVRHEKTLTPPFHEGVVYDVLEPFSGTVVDGDAWIVFGNEHIPPGFEKYPADRLPLDRVRQQATPTTQTPEIVNGKVVFKCTLEVVEK